VQRASGRMSRTFRRSEREKPRVKLKSRTDWERAPEVFPVRSNGVRATGQGCRERGRAGCEPGTPICVVPSRNVTLPVGVPTPVD
jgi:hypothetical protein